MGRMIAFVASAAINASTFPAVAADSTSTKDVDATRTRSPMVRSQLANAANSEKACRAYAASFYESVKLRQPAAKYADGDRTLTLLDSVINAFNDLLAKKCRGLNPTVL